MLKSFVSLMCACFTAATFANSGNPTAVPQSNPSPSTVAMPSPSATAAKVKPFDPSQPFEVVATPAPSATVAEPDTPVLAASELETGLRYMTGDRVEKSPAEAVKWFRRAAERNYAPAQFNLGAAYHNGDGVPRDFAEATKWFRKAAEHNQAMAQYELGLCYSRGEGVPQDGVEGAKWFRKAAEQNYTLAQIRLAECYYFGQGVRTNYIEAIKWAHKAAEQNDARAQGILGFCYYFGNGVAKNYSEASKWLRKAADQDWAPAQFKLGACYSLGQGVSKSYAEAVKWFRKAAEQNNAPAQLQLALRYYLGEGVPKNYVEAYKWWLLAAAQGDNNAKEDATTVENQMSRDQIAEGQRLAREFQPRQLPSTQTDADKPAVGGAPPIGSGTGFFITEDGYLITNEHVAGSGAQVRLLTASGLLAAKVVKVDAANDLALLKAEAKLSTVTDILDSKSEAPLKLERKFQPLPLVSSRAAKLGSTVITVGFPNIGLQGFAPKFARGDIASLTGPEDDPKFFQISVPLQPGNSGGALLDERGNVIGIVSGKLSASAALKTTGELPENVNYAVKSSLLLSFLESVPEVASKLREPNTPDMQTPEVVEKAKAASVLVLIY